MPQSNLLELAKHGEPSAIAALMNAVLVPKGIIARASLEDDCLSVFLDAPKPVNQAAIVQFVQKGLRQLESETIQSVKVHSQKFGDESLSWTESFFLYPERLSATSQATDHSNARLEDASSALANPSEGEETEEPSEAIDRDDRTIGEESSLKIESTPDNAEDETDSLTIAAWIQARWKRYALPVALVVVGGFVAGGSIVVWSTRLQTQSVAASSQDDTPIRKQQEAEAYLKRMNQAQEKFYQQNKRFAGSLEELERSANVIARSYSYAYRLRLGKASMITAIPRESGLKSYVGAVFPVGSKTEGVICQTMKPSMQAPTRPQFSASKKQAACGTRSIELP